MLDPSLLVSVKSPLFPTTLGCDASMRELDTIFGEEKENDALDGEQSALVVKERLLPYDLSGIPHVIVEYVVGQFAFISHVKRIESVAGPKYN